MAMDDELRRELLNYLKHERGKRQAEEDAEPIFSKGIIDWDFIAAVVGFTAGGPLAGKVMREAKKEGFGDDFMGYLKSKVKKALF